MSAGDVNGLTHFRADPRKVRVAVRRDGRRGWLASVRARDQSVGDFCGYRGNALVEWTGRGAVAAAAIDHALATAAHDGLDGVVLSMAWSYEHPFCTPSQRAHHERIVPKSNVVEFRRAGYEAKPFYVETVHGTFHISGTLCGHVDIAVPQGATLVLSPNEVALLIDALHGARSDVLDRSKPFDDPMLLDRGSCPTCEGCGRVPTCLFDAVQVGPLRAPNGISCAACGGTGKRLR